MDAPSRTREQEEQHQIEDSDQAVGNPEEDANTEWWSSADDEWSGSGAASLGIP